MLVHMESQENQARTRYHAIRKMGDVKFDDSRTNDFEAVLPEILSKIITKEPYQSKCIALRMMQLIVFRSAVLMIGPSRGSVCVAKKARPMTHT
jgi:hypothetical protein